ncbi:uncharacterized protein J4E79_001257 [Alternaria viburni]|uniref:uncharacterized protein n=1 Tax=Alternaria viburni TaxID=566460 RepID=UPI0020C460E3|nr:uncharacterized protein J4E79_001257 [Alternaria viburni]KAI4669214.1 hypothetical protein J4E79_001257 [Alternaria viburni]
MHCIDRRIHQHSQKTNRFVAFEPRCINHAWDTENSRPKDLTIDQLCRAQALANGSNYQHPDEDIIERMRARNDVPSTQEANSPEHLVPPLPLTPISLHSDVLARSLPVPATDPPKAAPVISQTHPCAKLSPEDHIWEEKACKGIAHKGLSLDKVWDKKTWKQKANNIERLKLLKDDGYDIKSLQAPKTSADAIIEALLAHVKVRKEKNLDLAASTVLQSTPSEEVPEVRKEDSYDPTPANDDDTAHAEPKEIADHVPSDAAPQGVPDFAQDGPESHDEPGSHDEPKLHSYIPPPVLAGLKRKHTHEDENQPDWHQDNPQKELHEAYNTANSKTLVDLPCTCGIAKIARVLTREDLANAFAKQAAFIYSRKIGRDIFRYAREKRRMFQDPKSKESFNNCMASWRPSRIIFQSPPSVARQSCKPHVYISAQGIKLMMWELSHIAYDPHEDGSWCIADPDEIEDRKGDGLMEACNPVKDEFRYKIRIFETPTFPMIIEGETMALVGLLRRLRKSGISYYHKGQYDPQRMEVVSYDNENRQLSDATETALEDAEQILEAEHALGGVEVHIGWLESSDYLDDLF